MVGSLELIAIIAIVIAMRVCALKQNKDRLSEFRRPGIMRIDFWNVHVRKP